MTTVSDMVLQVWWSNAIEFHKGQPFRSRSPNLLVPRIYFSAWRNLAPLEFKRSWRWIQQAYWETPGALGLYKLSHSNLQIQPFITRFWANSNGKSCRKTAKRYNSIKLWMGSWILWIGSRIQCIWKSSLLCLLLLMSSAAVLSHAVLASYIEFIKANSDFTPGICFSDQHLLGVPAAKCWCEMS